MKHMLRATLVSLIIGLVGVWPVVAQDFEQVGGPYEVDDNTVLLMHFDGSADLQIGEGFEVADPVLFKSNEDGTDTTYFGNTGLPSRFDQQIFIDNNDISDSTYFAIPDTADLDLTGNWTIETWVNVFTFTEGGGSVNNAPRMFVKNGPATDATYFGLLQATGNVNTGYVTELGGTTVNVATGGDVAEANTWYHVAFLRDTTTNTITQLIHTPDGDDADDEPDLVFAGTASFDTDDVITNDEPLFIGGFPEAGDSWLDGYLDEFRISNVVRNFRAPPTITNVTDLPNQTADSTAPYQVEATIGTLGEASPDQVTLHYDILGEGAHDSTDFQDVQMQPVAGSETRYVGEIPEQSVGTSVRYYISAELGGLVSEEPTPTAEDDGDIFYQFAVVEPESQTLHLTFEEGEPGSTPQTGDIQDESYMDHRVEVEGTPSYTDDAIVGDRAIHFAPEDSAYLEIDSSPALASREYLLDFWFKVDSVTTGGRYILKEASSLEEGPAFWINYKVFTFAADQSLRGAFYQEGIYPDGGGLNGGQLDPGVVPDTGTWYRARLFASEERAFFTFRDQDGNVVGEAEYESENLPALETSGPFVIGFGFEPGSNYFYGTIDDVKFYNYGREPQVTSIGNVTQLKGTLSSDEAPFEVTAEAQSGSGTSLAEQNIYYSVNGGDFQTAELSDQGDGTYVGEIPEQDPGTYVEYYVAIEDDEGTRVTRPAGVEGAENPQYYNFGVGATQAKMLHLTFEEGEGVPANGTDVSEGNSALYDLPITLGGINGEPSYSDENPARGSYALQFEEADSSFLRIDPAPFLSSNEFLLDFWFRPEDNAMEPGDRLVLKQGGEGLTGARFHVNYKVFTFGGGANLRGASWQFDGGLNGGLLDTEVQPSVDEWQRAIYYMSQDTAYFAFFTQDENGDYQLTESNGYSGENLPAAITYGPFHIGAGSEPAPGEYEAYFNGEIDEVKFYNYAQDPPQELRELLGTPAEDLPQGPVRSYQLEANYPNPFRTQTTIRYALPEAGPVRLEVYDLLGRRVATLVNDRVSAGWHEVQMQPEELASGVYFYRLQAGDTIKTRKMTLMR